MSSFMQTIHNGANRVRDAILDDHVAENRKGIALLLKLAQVVTVVAFAAFAISLSGSVLNAAFLVLAGAIAKDTTQVLQNFLKAQNACTYLKQDNLFHMTENTWIARPIVECIMP